MEKDLNNFRKMNCDDCQCNICLGSCMACSECYRAEYAQEDWQDYYWPHEPDSVSCHEF